MTSAVAEDDRIARRNGIEVVPSRVAFLSQEEFIVAIATQPFLISKNRETTSERSADVSKGMGTADIHSTKAASPGKQMEMRVDKPWKNRLSSARESLRSRRNERTEVLFCSP